MMNREEWRRGFTLAELLVAMVLAGIIGMAVVRMVLTTQRTSQLMAQRIDVQQNVRTTIQYLSSALRELDATDGDIRTADSSALKIRGMRWTGILCADPVLAATNVVLPIRTTPFYGLRRPDATLDSVLIFRDGDVDTGTDDRWLAGSIVTSTTGVCADGSVAQTLTVSVAASSGGADSVMVGVSKGGPIRGFQIEELSLKYGGDARWWIAQRTATKAAAWSGEEPMLGPLAVSGLALTYRDKAGAPTASLTNIASVGLRIQGESYQRAHGPQGTGFIRDSLLTHIALRNNRRY